MTLKRNRFLIVGNQAAGRGRGDLVDAVMAQLRDAGAEVARSAARSEVEALVELKRLAGSGEAGAIIAAGGDGTIRLAAKAAAGTRVALGAIPLGTGNVLSHEIGLPRDAAALARVLLEAPARPVHTATANGELILLMAGVGYDGRVIAALDLRLKQRVGQLAFGIPGVRALLRGPDNLLLEIDGKAHTACWAIVSNAGRYGSQFVLTRKTSINEPGLVAVLFHDASSWRRARDIVALGLGRLDALAGTSESGVTMHACSEVTVRSADPVPVQVDGDVFGTTPLVVKAGGPVVHLIMP